MMTWQRWRSVDLFVFITGLVAAGLWLAGLTTTPLDQPLPILDHTEPIGEIRGAQTVGQMFYAPYGGLYRVDVSLADYGRANNGLVTFRLETAPGSEVLVERQFAADEIHGDVIYHFEFPALSDSGGQDYYFELAAPEAVTGNAITAYIQLSGTYQGGQAYFAGRPVSGDYVFALHYKVSAWERTRIWLAQVAAGKPGLWGWPGLFVLIGAVYIGLIAGMAWSLAHTSVP